MKITFREIVFLAILTVVYLLFAAIPVPLIMSVRRLGIQSLLEAVQYGIFATLAARRVRKYGSISIMGLISGLFLSFMVPVMGFNQIIGALSAEIISFLFFGSYQRKSAISLSACLWPVLTIPISGIFNMVFQDRSLSQQIGNPLIFIGIIIGTLFLAYLGSKLGHKISDELERAGKI